MSELLLSIELEGLPPTVNHLYRSTRSGRRYKTEVGREYQQSISNAIMEAYTGSEPYTGAVELHVIFETNNRRKWDIDNRIKALQDCLSMAGVLLDDRQVEALSVRRVYGCRMATKIEVRGL